MINLWIHNSTYIGHFLSTYLSFFANALICLFNLCIPPIKICICTNEDLDMHRPHPHMHVQKKEFRDILKYIFFSNATCEMKLSYF